MLYLSALQMLHLSALIRAIQINITTTITYTTYNHCYTH